MAHEAPTPPAERLARATADLEETLKKPESRKRLRQAAQKCIEEVERVVRDATPRDGTPRLA